MRSALTGILPSNLDYQWLALRVLPLLFATSAACASTENPQPVLVINGGAAGVGGEASGGTAGSSGGAGAQGGSGATGGSMGGTGASAGTDAGGSAGLTSGGTGGVGGSAGTDATGGSAGSGAMGGSAGTGAAGSGAGGAGGTGAMGGSAGSSGGSGGGGTVNLYFSEYLEGDQGTDKAVEIYNAGDPILLSECKIHIYSNGNATANINITLDSQSLPNKGVWLVCVNASAAGTVPCDQISGSLSHNGNDAIELECNGTRLDLIGKTGSDPGTAWTGGGLSTANMTLLRKCSVTAGNTAGFTDPSIEWQAPAGGAGVDKSNLGKTSCP